ncbi:alpha/beta fold hydrolase [Ornithinimicrobium sp. INDO-MA30-4]|uniref:alpha/beta fold hydrolase n=1 Tax=Ornithinimicrobium sp. INDO-MA30-4 TaxID=2908651 RepID=UPI001F2C3959|nr:alpha/beta fold hydrolase [Ornithinimicrobium sp. INDO-MA30-4]UJH71661.1 alpha/beta fold hydrolase [Ornithinimicrobium sp. INDO-MA30-4]
MKPLVRPAHRLTRWARAAPGVSLFAAVGVTAPLAQAAESDDSSAAEPTTSTVAVGDESDGSTVELDVDTFYPAQTPAPAVVLAHGFGGSKDSVAAQAADLQSAGYVVLTYTARGFGASGGRVHLNDPDFEIADVSALIDVLASDDAVVQDGNDDPRVAVAGGSYGGAAALMSAGADDRVDSVVAAITWNDLGDAFFPQSAIQNPDQAGFANEPIDQPGPLKPGGPPTSSPASLRATPVDADLLTRRSATSS